MKKIKKAVTILSVLGIFLPEVVRAQIYPETLWVPVTFYDFHSNKSNPEFECQHQGARRRNMVDSLLDAARKPKLGSQPYINYYIKYWFRPWSDSARGDSTVPVYRCVSNCNSEFQATVVFDGITKVNHDTAFKNIVIRDSLPFILDRTPGVPAGTYVYRNDNFFPLDNRGFGNEGRNHNFSFTMELNWKFVKVPGLKFVFRGDDDVWVFINGKLYMDIGGIHNAVSDTLFIDSIPGLIDGQTYTLDLFYAERHTTESHIWIASNVISAEPTRVEVSVYPNDTICAGDRLTAIGVVLDEKGQPIPELADSIRWRIIPNGANNNSHLSNLQGDTTYFRPTEAYAYDGIEGRLMIGNTIIYDTIWVYVKACYPHHVVIEGTPPPFTNPSLLRNDNPLAEIVIPPTSTSGRGYAIVRDTFGNFIEASDSTQWTISGGAQYLDRVVVGNKSIGEGIVYKKDTLKSEGTGEITARSLKYPTIKTDNVPVRIQQISYDSLQISIWDGTNYRRISSLVTTTDRDTDLIVRARRSDNGQWEVVSGSWSLQPTTIRTVNPPPTSAQLWEFFPIDTGRGTIRVVNGSLTASISVVINPGAPAVLRLYRNAADTVGYLNPPHVYYDSAGVVFPLYAKIFDSRGVWLKQYDSLSAPIYWSIIEVAGTPPTGSLTRTMGNQNGFTPTRADNVVDIVARFSVGSNTIADTVRIRVLPGKPDHITIQADTGRNSPDLTELQIQSNQTEVSLYAILRDKYGNFIDYAVNADWWSADTNVVIAQRGTYISLGEGKVIRNSDVVSVTYVYAISEDGKMKDSVRVRLTDITYDQLRIYIITEGGKKLVDTVRIRTDESLTLYVEGRRSDGTGWDNIPATWSKSSGLKTVGNPPSWSTNWNVIPDSVGNGIIVVSRTGAISDTVVAIFLPGLPGSVKLYRMTGNPTNAGPYPEPPAVDTFVVGTSYSIVAKVFDRNNVWLSEYESSSKDNLFSWSVTLVNGFSPIDTLNKRIGYQVSMMPTRAYNTYRITVTFTENSRTYTASVLVYVKPGSAERLVIEGSPNPTGAALQRDNPLNVVEFGSRDTVKYAYAILRDKFGNYVGRSQSTNWSSVDVSIVTATEGLASYGEGKITRTGTLGSTKVIAFNRNNPSLIDTVDVVLNSYSFDSLKIVVRDSIPIEYLVIKADEDTLLQVIGKRSFDGVWVPVDGNWSYISNTGTQSATGTSAWKFTPTDTGSGIIVVSRSGAVSDTITVKVNPGNPAKLELYAKEGPVPNATNPPYPDPTIEITAIAGTPFPLVAKIFDKRNVWLPAYEQRSDMSKLIKWKIVELPGTDSSGFLDDTLGHKRSFTPVRAYQSVYVVAYMEIGGGSIIADTVKLKIAPGKPKRLVLEGSSTYDPIRAHPIDTVRITFNATSARVYAILRDSLGNFVSYSTVTQWGVVNNDTSVSVRSGNTTVGEGVITRNVAEARVKIFGVDVGTGFRDTTFVILLPYYFTRLRIVVGDDTNAQSLTMTTNDDTTLKVQGLRSDSLIWVDIEAHWENSSNLKIVPNAPGWAHKWRFSPADTGKGWIRVTLDDDENTIPDTLPVIFLPGPPTSVVVSILTPADKRIAGEPIELLVTLYNKDGVVPGTYCFDTVRYTDTLGTGGRPRPFVVIDKDTVWLGESGKQCFENGRDTVKVTLYYVPIDPDSLHRITVKVGNLVGRTPPFVLHPGALDSLAIEYNERTPTPVGDTITLHYPKGSVTLYAIGYDKYGNRIGPIQSNWGTDSTLHPVDKGTNTERIVYTAINVTDNEAGNLIAIPADPDYSNIKASVFVKIKGPLTELIKARTRDANGNGYLDQVELTFSKAVEFPKDYDTKNIVIRYGENIFIVDSIIGAGRGADSVWVVALKEIQNNKPQTNWTPFVSIVTPDERLQLDSTINLVAEDGAGPVIWAVYKTITKTDDRKQDIIRVVFSEDIQRATGEGQSLTINDKVEMILYVWEAIPDPSDPTKITYKLIDSMLVGIENMQAVREGEIEFLTLNGVDIAPRHYVSIKVVITSNGDTTAYITDRAKTPNLPEYNNQKVRVFIKGPAPEKVHIAPNPSRPTAAHTPPGQLEVKHNPEAKYWVSREKAGVLMRFTIKLPESDTVKISCMVKVYDMVGNPVISASNPNILKTLPPEALRGSVSVYDIDLYWNGCNKLGMPVAPGLYKVFVYLDSNHPEYRKKKPLAGIVGISK